MMKNKLNFDSEGSERLKNLSKLVESAANSILPDGIFREKLKKIKLPAIPKEIGFLGAEKNDSILTSIYSENPNADPRKSLDSSIH